MAATLEQIARAFAARYPTPASHPNGGDGSWDQDCGRLMFRMCAAHGRAPTGDVHSAYMVYTRSKIVSKDPSKALPGDFHFWSIAGPENGHVGLDVRGRGRTVFMGTNSVTERLNPGIGFLSVAGYTAAKAGRAVYLGHSRGYANGDVTAFALTQTAGTGTTPLPAVPAVPPTPTRKKKSMTTGYHTTRPGKPMEWALAGDGVGKAAWIPVGNAAAQSLAGVHGNFVELSPSSFDAFKAFYTSGQVPVATTIGTVTIDAAALAPLLAAINALPENINANYARRVAQ